MGESESARLRTSEVMVDVGLEKGWGAKLALQEAGPPALSWASGILGGQPCKKVPRQAGGSTLLRLVGASDGPRLMLNVEIVTQSWVSCLLAFNTSLVFNKTNTILML